MLPRRPLAAASLALVVAPLAACSLPDTGTPGTAETDREAQTLGIAISFPRQQDASGLARAALAVWSNNNRLDVLEAADLHPASPAGADARLVIRIHVAEEPAGPLGRPSPAYDACYRLDYDMPSSALIGRPDRIGCPTGAAAITPPPAPPVPHLPAGAADRLARVLQSLPAHPTQAAVEAALARAFPPPAYVSATVRGHRLGAAVGVSRGVAEVPDCAIALRTGRRVRPIHADRMTLMPGEVGCVAEQAVDGPFLTH